MSVELLESFVRFTIQGKIQDMSINTPAIHNLQEKNNRISSFTPRK